MQNGRERPPARSSAVVPARTIRSDMEREARGKMITTTLVDYNEPGDVKDDYTSRRTSKVTYRSERSLADPLRSWTRRIEQASRLGECLQLDL